MKTKSDLFGKFLVFTQAERRTVEQALDLLAMGAAGLEDGDAQAIISDLRGFYRANAEHLRPRVEAESPPEPVAEPLPTAPPPLPGQQELLPVGAGAKKGREK
ncbi:MAG: hypothetical protein ABFE07_12075 [Armatimonadia bacterium]